MNCAIRYTAYALNILLIIASLYFMTQAYGRDVLYCVLLLLPPVFSIMAIKTGPDLEERRLFREVSKARLRAELDQFNKAQPKGRAKK